MTVVNSGLLKHPYLPEQIMSSTDMYLKIMGLGYGIFILNMEGKIQSFGRVTTAQ